MSAPYHIEADLSDDIKADIAFTYSPATPPSEDDPEGCTADVWIDYIQPIGIAPPITPKDLGQLAHDWLFERGGREACCRYVEEREGTWE